MNESDVGAGRGSGEDAVRPNHRSEWPGRSNTTGDVDSDVGAGRGSGEDAVRPKIVGWREWAVFPELDLPPMKAKIDTGARTSAIHAFDMRRSVEDGVEMVTFEVHPHQDDDETSITVRAAVADERDITSSNGQTELRPVIRTLVRLGDREWPIELTLTNRDSMGFRLLLGRTALAKEWHVDPSRSYIQGRRTPASDVSSNTPSTPTTNAPPTPGSKAIT